MISFRPYKIEVQFYEETDDGTLKKAKHVFLSKSTNYTDAEITITKFMEDNDDYNNVISVTITKVKYDYIFMPVEADPKYPHHDFWFLIRTTSTETTEKGKVVINYSRYMVNASDIKSAFSVVESYMESIGLDSDTKIDQVNEIELTGVLGEIDVNE